MDKELNENDLGLMVGKFYSDVFGYDIEVMYEKGISQEYVERNIEYFNNLDQNFIINMCTSLKRYYESYKKLYPDLCDELPSDILENFDKDPTSILKYVKIGVYRFHKCKASDEDIPVLNLGGHCEWAGDAGITIVAKKDHLIYVGRWQDRNVWENREESSLEKMFNYALPIA